MPRNVPRSPADADKPNRMPLYLAGGGVLLLLGCFVCTGGALTMWLVLKSDKSDRDKTAVTASKETAKIRAKELIVGRWESLRFGPGSTYEFTQDGRFIHQVRGDRPQTGSYVVLDETHMEITTEGEFAGTAKVTISVSETELSITNTETGGHDTYKRAR
jgi:hypothetical protein